MDMKNNSRNKMRLLRHRRLRRHLSGTAARPRLAVFRSLHEIYAQVIDDTVGRTLCSCSTLDKELRAQLTGSHCTIEAAQKVGAMVAKRALDKGITAVVFDRGGHAYHGRVAALADAAREAGLKL